LAKAGNMLGGTGHYTTPAYRPNTAVYDTSDPTNTTIFIGNLSASVPEFQLRGIFSAFGELVYVRIPPGKGCGFVQFVHRKDAEIAMVKMHGSIIGGQAVRCSWGRSGRSRNYGGHGGYRNENNHNSYNHNNQVDQQNQNLSKPVPVEDINAKFLSTLSVQPFVFPQQWSSSWGVY